MVNRRNNLSKSCLPKLLTETIQLVWIFFSSPKPLAGFKLSSFHLSIKAKVCRITEYPELDIHPQGS